MFGARRVARRTARRTTRRATRRRAAVIAPVARRSVRRPLARLLALGGTAAVAYKLGQNSVQRIEQQAGKPFDQLSEDELANSMETLGIELEDEGDTGGAPVEEQPDYLDELERLAGLRDKGIISDEEFQAKKQQLLGL